VQYDNIHGGYVYVKMRSKWTMLV